MVEKRCPICSGGGQKIHKGVHDNEAIDVYRCLECGTKFLDLQESKFNYEDGEMFATDNLGDLGLEERLKVFSVDEFRRYEMLKEICRNKNILDFGCGYGGFLQYVSKVANACAGVELGKNERVYCNKKGIRCCKTIDEFEEKFDIITLFHVFEHLLNPKMWLHKFSDYLIEGGYLIIEVPNADDALLSLYDSEKFADFTYWSAHPLLYTAKSLTMIIEETGKYSIESDGQVQRYSIANHLMWLAKGKPGGHEMWSFLDTQELNEAYSKKLQELRMCDTLFFILHKV